MAHPPTEAMSQFTLLGDLQETQAEVGYLRIRNRKLAELVIALRARLSELEPPEATVDPAIQQEDQP